MAPASCVAAARRRCARRRRDRPAHPQRPPSSGTTSAPGPVTSPSRPAFGVRPAAAPRQELHWQPVPVRRTTISSVTRADGHAWTMRTRAPPHRRATSRVPGSGSERERSGGRSTPRPSPHAAAVARRTRTWVVPGSGVTAAEGHGVGFAGLPDGVDGAALSRLLEGCVENLRLVHRSADGLFPYSSRLGGAPFANDYRQPESFRYTVNTLLGLLEAARAGIAGVEVAEVDAMTRTFLAAPRPEHREQRRSGASAPPAQRAGRLRPGDHRARRGARAASRRGSVGAEHAGCRLDRLGRCRRDAEAGAGRCRARSE